jgi:hypothetical protein
VSDAEARLVLACVREPDVDPEGALRSAADAVGDWDRVAMLARINSVAALVSAAAERAGIPLPATAAAALRDEEIACVATAMVLDRALARTLTACADRSISVIVLKGPVLARTAYHEPVFRPYADLDLVVHREDGEGAADVCRALGFRECETGAWSRRAPKSPFHRRFGDASGRILVELHTDPLQLGLAPIDEDERWSRAIAAPWLGGRGTAAYILGDSDQLVQLCVHAHKHGFNRLIWLKDIDLLVRGNAPGLSWSLVASTASREGVSASVWYALRLCGELLGTPLPAIAGTMAPAPLIRALYRRIWPVRTVAGLEAEMHRRAVQFDVAESWRGMLPTVLLMGRRAERIRLLGDQLARRSVARPS